MSMIAKTAFRCLILVSAALVAPFFLSACTGTDPAGNPTIATAPPGPGVDSAGPTVPGNVVPTIGGGAGNGGGVSGGGAGVGSGH